MLYALLSAAKYLFTVAFVLPDERRWAFNLSISEGLMFLIFVFSPKNQHKNLHWPSLFLNVLLFALHTSTYLFIRNEKRNVWNIIYNRHGQVLILCSLCYFFLYLKYYCLYSLSNAAPITPEKSPSFAFSKIMSFAGVGSAFTFANSIERS